MDHGDLLHGGLDGAVVIATEKTNDFVLDETTRSSSKFICGSH
jgi:hypothetical protein